MDNYKITLKKRIRLFAMINLLSAFFITYNVLFPSNQPSNTQGLQMGLLTGLIILFVFQIIRYNSALHDEVKLKVLYNQEHDERLKLIRYKAGMPMIAITSGFIIFSAMIANYYNETIFYILIAVAMIQMLISVFVKLYYLKKN